MPKSLTFWLSPLLSSACFASTPIPTSHIKKIHLQCWRKRDENSQSCRLKTSLNFCLSPSEGCRRTVSLLLLAKIIFTSLIQFNRCSCNCMLSQSPIECLGSGRRNPATVRQHPLVSSSYPSNATHPYSFTLLAQSQRYSCTYLHTKKLSDTHKVIVRMAV